MTKDQQKAHKKIRKQKRKQILDATVATMDRLAKAGVSAELLRDFKAQAERALGREKFAAKTVNAALMTLERSGVFRLHARNPSAIGELADNLLDTVLQDLRRTPDAEGCSISPHAHRGKAVLRTQLANSFAAFSRQLTDLTRRARRAARKSEASYAAHHS